ncbi:MAG: ORF6N domain-containing protein [bacterium]
MNNLVKINNQELTIKEYQGHRVVTFKDIDRLHERPEGTARKRFNDNKEKFIEGEDYYKICASEIRTNKIIDLSPKYHGDTILITESGYLMLVKSLTDDLAWKVQRELVKCYFKVQEQQELFIPTTKKYLGEDVATVKDVAYTLKRSEHNIRYLLTKCKRNEDYIVLNGDQLAHFKEQNPSDFMFSSWLLVIFKSGFRKICDMLGESFTKYDLFPIRRSFARALEEKCVDVPDNKNICFAIENIRKSMVILDALLSMYARYNPAEYQEHLKPVMRELGSRIAGDVLGLVNMKYKLIDSKFM